jgi:hypothetical protein
MTSKTEALAAIRRAKTYLGRVQAAVENDHYQGVTGLAAIAQDAVNQQFGTVFAYGRAHGGDLRIVKNYERGGGGSYGTSGAYDVPGTKLHIDQSMLDDGDWVIWHGSELGFDPDAFNLDQFPTLKEARAALASGEVGGQFTGRIEAAS